MLYCVNPVCDYSTTDGPTEVKACPKCGSKSFVGKKNASVEEREETKVTVGVKAPARVLPTAPGIK